ncbi:MAG: hypothetical protein LC808_30390 [Actinobacteria bacterium]|nr:hypothetical protein [Actinomycetota bacterium]
MDRQILRDWFAQVFLWYFIAFTTYVIYLTASTPGYDVVSRILPIAGWLAMLLTLLRATRFRIEIDRDGLDIFNFFSPQHVDFSEILDAAATFYGIRLSLTSGETVTGRGITRPNVPWETKADRVADYINSEARKRRELEGYCGYQVPGGWCTDSPPHAYPRPWEDPYWLPSKAPLKRDKTGRAVVRLMPEYLVELPLWDQDWRVLHLEPPLLSALAEWQQQFDDHFMPSKGWTDTAVRDEWAAAAEVLTRRLRRALPKDVDLVVDLWPLTASR